MIQKKKNELTLMKLKRKLKAPLPKTSFGKNSK